MRADERQDRALDDRDAKCIIGVMLALQVFVLLGTMLWP